MKRREQLDADAFKNFIEPVFAQLKAVHENYLASFDKYRALISATTEALDNSNPIFAEINADAAASAHLRSQIRASCAYVNDEKFSDFFVTVFMYLEAGTDVPKSAEELSTRLDKRRIVFGSPWENRRFLTMPYFWDHEDGDGSIHMNLGTSNSLRWQTRRQMEGIFARSIDDPNEKRLMALKGLESIVWWTQARFENAVYSYSQLKASLLTPP